MDQTTKWLIRIMAVVVIAGVGGGIYVVSEERAEKSRIEREKECKNDPLYLLTARNARMAAELEYLQGRRGSSREPGQRSYIEIAREADDLYEKCLEKR